MHACTRISDRMRKNRRSITTLWSSRFASSKATPTDTTLLRDGKTGTFWTDFPKSAVFGCSGGFWWIRRGNGFETLDSSWLPFVRGSVGADDEGSFEGNTQKNHETRESILRTDFAGLGERDGKSAENGLQNRFSSTKNSLQHAVRKCENQKSYPHSCAQMWVNSADNSWITHCFVVENSCITATSMWKTQIRRTGCGKLAHLSTSHAEFVHKFQGLMTVAVVGPQPYLSTLSTGLIMAITYSVT